MTHELRELMLEAKADAPPLERDIESFLADGRKLVRRRRATTMVTAAAALAVAAGAAVPHWVTQPATRPGPQAGGSSTATPETTRPVSYPQGPYEWAFRGYRTGVFTVTDPLYVTPGYQQARIARGDEYDELHGTPQGTVKEPSGSAVLTVYRPGVYDPVRFSGAENATVNGRPGLYATYVPLNDDTGESYEVPPFWAERLRETGKPVPAEIGRPPGMSLAWQYTDGGWAVISTWEKYTRDELVTIASGLAGTEPVPTMVAFTVSSLPAGYKLDTTGTTKEELLGPTPGSYVRFSRGAGHNYNKLSEPILGDIATNPVRHLSIKLSPSWYAKHSPPKGTPRNRAYCPAENLCYRATDDGKYQVEVIGSGESNAELLKVLNGLTFADVDNLSTWVPISTAVQATGS